MRDNPTTAHSVADFQNFLMLDQSQTSVCLFQWSSAEQVFAAAATSSSLLLKGGVWVLGLSAWHAVHLHIASDVPECIIDFCGALVCAICAAALVAAVPSSVCQEQHNNSRNSDDCTLGTLRNVLPEAPP